MVAWYSAKDDLLLIVRKINSNLMEPHVIYVCYSANLKYCRA